MNAWVYVKNDSITVNYCVKSHAYFTQYDKAHPFCCKWHFFHLFHCFFCVCMQSCPILCNPMDCRPRGSAVHGIFQARILEWVVLSYSRGSSQPRDRTHGSCISCIGSQILYHCATWEATL